MKRMKIFNKAAAMLLSAAMVVSSALGLASGAQTAKAETPGTAITDADFLKASGKNLYNADGELIQLKGTNVGGWFVQEFWMTITNATANVTAQVDVDRILEERFGKEGLDELTKAYMDSYITEDDLDKMLDLGVNCIRAPFWWRNIADADGNLIDGAFDYLDWLVEEAGQRGMYVIVDFHGAPGSQNASDHSGVDGKDDKQGASHFFWGDDAAHNQEMYYALCEDIARHYAGNPVVAGFDLLNEPYCTYRYNTQYSDDELHELLWNIYDIAYDRIRAIDPDHVLIMEATWNPADLPNPDDYGWENVMYEYHNYLYDDYNNANGQQIANMESKLSAIGTADYDVPSYMGEFSYFDNIDAWDQGLELLAKSGISYTTWTYKTISDYGNWGLVHQENAGVDLENDSYEDILAAYSNAGTTSDNTALQQVAEKWFKYQDVENTLGPKLAEIADGAYYIRGNHSGKVVEVTSDGLVHGGNSAFIADDNQIVTITNVAEGIVIMQFGDKYVTVDENGILHADADSADAAEQFVPVAAGGSAIGFRSTTTHLFTCLDENFEDFRLVADRSGTDSWETFFLNDPTKITTETYSGWTRYEGEMAQIHGGAVESQDFYSAKKGVGSLNSGVPADEIAGDLSNIKYVAFTVEAPKAGTYRAILGYNGDDDKEIVVKINDAAHEIVSVPNVQGDHAWNAMHEKYLELELQAGENTVIISGTINNISTWMNVDYIDIADYPITFTADGAEIYESETFRTNGSPESQGFYSNGVGVGNMNSNCEYANLAADFSNAKYVDYTVYVPEAGTYDITWHYNGESFDNMPAAFKVNGGDKKSITLNNAVSGAWNVMNSVTFTADLEAGLNDVLVTGTLVAFSNWANHDYIAVAPHEAIPTDRYEAEGAELHNVNVTGDNADNCSGGEAVGSTENQIGFADIAEDWSNVKHLVFTVDVAKAGTYGLTIAYYGDDDKTVALQVNDEAAAEISVPNVQPDHQWNAIHTVITNVNLGPGQNTIKLSGILNGQGWINYDYIEISEPFEIEEEEPEATHTRYESEEANLHNVNITNDNGGKCSGGYAVGSTENQIGIDAINDDWSNIKYVDYTVEVPEDGYYEVIVAYYGDDDKTVAYKVNDSENIALPLPRLAGGAWDNIHKVPVIMQLQAGENHIVMSGILNGQGWVNYDYIDVSIATVDAPEEPTEPEEPETPEEPTEPEVPEVPEGRYEAEGADLHGVNVTNDNAGNCSSGAAVGSTENQIGFAEIAEDWSNVKYVGFDVTVETAGMYDMTIAYYGDDDKTVAYKVNGEDAVELAVPNVQADHQWNAIHTIVVPVHLEAGANRIQLSGILNGQGWINYDYIELALTAADPEESEPEETPEETESEPEETPEETESEPEETPEVTEPEETTPEETPEVTESEETTPEETPEVTEPEETTPEETPAVTEPEETTPEETPAETEDPGELPPVLDPDEGGETGDMSQGFYLVMLMAGLAGMAVSFRKKIEE